MGGVHATAAGDHCGSCRGFSRGAGSIGGHGSRGRRGVAGGADLGKADFKLALDLGAVPEKHGEVGAVESPILRGLPLEIDFIGAAGKVTARLFGLRVFLHDGLPTGGTLLLEGNRLLCLSQDGDAKQKAGEQGFHALKLPRRAEFDKRVVYLGESFT